MNKITILLIALIVISVGLLSGCQEQSGVFTSTKPPVNINLFASVPEGELIRFYFVLEDADGRNTIYDGHVSMKIFDDFDNSLYNEEFDVKSSEFIDYEFRLTGKDIGKAYEWRVLDVDIEKGISLLGFGRAVLVFITPDLKSLHAEDTLVQIPTYTEEELENIYEGEYVISSTSINKRLTKGNFEITVTNVGYFDKYEVGVMNRYFRVDMEVKNVGSESDYFLPSGVVIIDSQSIQYEYTYGGTLDMFSTVYPDVTKKGYLLFENIPDTETFLRLVFELGYDMNFNPYVFEYAINLI